MKNLLIYARICPNESLFSIKLLEMFKTIPNLEIKILDASLPFDHVKEQEYIKQFDNIVLLFPINWFNIPWNLSRYMAEVWRVGDFNLQNKKFHLIITTGSDTHIYSEEGFGWDVKSYLNNFYSVMKRLKASVESLDVFYGCATKKPSDKEFIDFVDNIKNIYINKFNK